MKRREFFKYGIFGSISSFFGGGKKLKQDAHVGNCAERTKTRLPERIYSEEWQRVNTRKSWLNHGGGTLEIILSSLDWEERGVEPLSERDIFVAATVVQWLGTNCGLGFIMDCEARIREERKKDRGIKYA